jgi:hypothetical protein
LYEEDERLQDAAGAVPVTGQIREHQRPSVFESALGPAVYPTIPVVTPRVGRDAGLCDAPVEFKGFKRADGRHALSDVRFQRSECV